MSGHDPLIARSVIDVKDLQRVFETLGNSVLFDEPMLDFEDVTALRNLAEACNIDPKEVTPAYVVADFPHRFEPSDANEKECGICARWHARIVTSDAQIHAVCEATWGTWRCELPHGHKARHRDGQVSWPASYMGAI